MNETEFLGNVPAWLKYLGTAVGSAGIAGLSLRQWLSQASVDRAANDANVATINRLQAQVITERDRADALMRDREALVREVGELRGEVTALREQVETLTTLVKNGQVAHA